MKKILILLLTLSLASCSKDETEKPDYTDFFNRRTPSFSGKLNGVNFNWKYGSHYQMFTGAENGNGICSATDPVRILMFGLSDNYSTKQFTIITPRMNTTNQTDVNRVLSPGVKQFGGLYNGFQIRYSNNNNFYINNPDNHETLEILKIEEFVNYDNTKHSLAWIKIDNLILENINQNGEILEIKEGFLIAELYGYIY